MDNSLSPLHALGKFPEINRNYLPAVVFTIFKFSPYCFHIKFTTTLLLTLNGELDWNGGLGPQQYKMPCVWSLDSVDTKWMWIIYIKFLVDTLVLIRVSLQAANCAWPWLNTISKKRAYQGTSSPSAFYLMFVLGQRYRLDMIGKLTSLGNWFLLVFLETSSASTCWFTFLCRYCWLTLHGFGPSAAFRFQVRVCAGLSCITNVALVL